MHTYSQNTLTEMPIAQIKEYGLSLAETAINSSSYLTGPLRLSASCQTSPGSLIVHLYTTQVGSSVIEQAENWKWPATGFGQVPIPIL